MDDPETLPLETPKTPAVSPLGLSLDEMREEVWTTAQANHPGLSKEEFLAISEAFGF
jgi:hypothetical protein